MKKKVLSVLLAAGMVAALMTGCGDSTEKASESSSSEATDIAEGGNYKVCYIAPAVADNPAYIKIMDFCKAEADSLGDIEFSYIDGESDTSKQISGIESCIVDSVDAIIIDPIEGEAVKSYVQEAMDSGIKVVSINANLDTCDVQCLIDQTQIGYEIGKAAAEFINDQFDGKAEIGLLHNEENTNLLLRENGIRDALKELAPNSEIVQEATADNQTDGMSGAENIMQANSDIHVIVCTNGSAALGAYEGALGMGVAKDATDFGIFASDCSDEELNLINEQTIYRCTVDLLQDIGPGTINAAEKLCRGEKMENMSLNLTVVTRDNISDYVS